MRALVDVTLAFTVAHGARIRALRAAAKQRTRSEWPVPWAMDEQHPSTFRFRGYAARYTASLLGDYTRLSYDRTAPWEKDIPYFNRFTPDVIVRAPKAYVVPQAWREVVERLQWNGVQMRRIEAPEQVDARVYHVERVTSRPGPYEGHMFHDEVTLAQREMTMTLQPGDWYVPLDQDKARYAVETLEPQGHDSFFRWGFFNSVLEKKEAYSDYVFEDLAAQMLDEEPALRAAFEAWKRDYPDLLTQQDKVLDFIFENGQRHVEPEWRRYPVVKVV
jgi:hypothetical protein